MFISSKTTKDIEQSVVYNKVCTINFFCGKKKSWIFFFYKLQTNILATAYCSETMVPSEDSLPAVSIVVDEHH